MQANIILTNSFADESTRKIKLEKFDISADAINIADLRNRVKSINSDVSNIENLYLSENGAKFTEISNVEVNMEETKTFI